MSAPDPSVTVTINAADTAGFAHFGFGGGPAVRVDAMTATATAEPLDQVIGTIKRLREQADALAGYRAAVEMLQAVRATRPVDMTVGWLANWLDHTQPGQCSEAEGYQLKAVATRILTRDVAHAAKACAALGLSVPSEPPPPPDAAAAAAGTDDEGDF